MKKMKYFMGSGLLMLSAALYAEEVALIVSASKSPYLDFSKPPLFHIPRQ
jgi:hypothetical protein